MTQEQKPQESITQSEPLKPEENRKIDKLMKVFQNKWTQRAGGAAAIVFLVSGGLYLLSKDKEGKRRYKAIIESVNNSKSESSKLVNGAEALKAEAGRDAVLNMVNTLKDKVSDEDAKSGMEAVEAIVKQHPTRNST